MCRSKSDPCGKRRCPSSKLRGQSAAAKSAVKEYRAFLEGTATPEHQSVLSPASDGVEALRERIAAFKERLSLASANTDPGMSESDIQLELELQEIGNEFVAEVDRTVEFSEDRMYRVLDSRLGEIFEAGETVELLKHELFTAVPGSPAEAALIERINLLEDMVANEDEHVSRVEREVFAEVNESYRKGYIDVLSQVRPLGSSVASVQLSSEYDSIGLAEQLQRTVFSHYPAEWLERHAEGPLMYVESDPENGAVHYNEAHPDERGELGTPATSFKNMTTDEEGRGFIREALLKHYTVVADGSRERSEGPANLIVYDLPEEEISASSGEDSRPDGEGWEYRTSMSYVLGSGFKTDEEFKEAATTKMWVRRLPRSERVVSRLNFYAPEIVESLGEEHTSAVLYHEFGHRMEHVLPDNSLPRMERAFLMRRAGKTDGTEHRGMMKNIISDEYYHRADFVDHYVGREYFTGRSYEVFSTGVEALLGKKFGGLIGLDSDNPRRDEDHRRFTLGVLAAL